MGKGKSVGVVCSTYRNPDKDSLVRLYGVVSLFDQMMHQNYDGDIKIALVDDSPEPHPFYREIEKAFPDRVVYMHVPSREQVDGKLEKEFPKALSFMPKNEYLIDACRLDIAARRASGETIKQAELKLAQGDFQLSPLEWDQVIGYKPGGNADSTDLAAYDFKQAGQPAPAETPEVLFWRDRIRETRTFANLVLYEPDYPGNVNNLAAMFNSRPTIGMKKNIGAQALAEKFGDYDVIVYADDDDFHSSDYVQQVVAAIEGKDFTRMTRYLTHVFNNSAEKQHWGEYNLPITQDSTGYYWRLPAEAAESEITCNHPAGHTFQRKMGDKFSQLQIMSWPLISHEGALHTYSFPTWKKSVEAFGGAAPVSFCEDIIYYRMLKDTFGREIKAAVTPVEEPAFIRLADGRNASVIYWMKDIAPEEVPAWAQESLAPLNAAASLPADAHNEILAALGRTYARTGELDLSLIRNPLPLSQIKPGDPAP